MTRLWTLVIFTFVSLDPTLSVPHSNVVTLTKISHGFLRYHTLCMFQPSGSSNTASERPDVRQQQTSTEKGSNDEGIYLKPWLSKSLKNDEESHPPDRSIRRRLQLDWNVRACRCNSECGKCDHDGVEPGDPLSICLHTTNSDMVDFMGVSEMTMSHQDQIMMTPILNRTANDDFTQVEQIDNSSVIVHTILPPIDDVPSNVVIEGKVYVTLHNDGRSLLEPTRSEFFRLEVPLMRPSGYVPSLQEKVYNTLKRRDFLVSTIVIFFLWIALCCVICGGKGNRSPQEESKAKERQVSSVGKVEETENEKSKV